jgi:hypothetical protein
MKERGTAAASDGDATDGAGAPTLGRLDELSEEITRLSKTARGFVDTYPLLTLGAVVLAGYAVARVLRR